MNLVLVSAATLLSVGLLSNQITAQQAPHNAQQRDIAANLSQAQSFAFLSRLYLRDNPSASGKVYASTLVAAGSTPASLQSARFPATWFLKVQEPGSLICTDIDRAAIDASRGQIQSALGSKLSFAHKDSQACA